MSPVCFLKKPRLIVSMSRNRSGVQTHGWVKLREETVWSEMITLRRAWLSCKKTALIMYNHFFPTSAYRLFPFLLDHSHPLFTWVVNGQCCRRVGGKHHSYPDFISNAWTFNRYYTHMLPYQGSTELAGWKSAADITHRYYLACQ